ncbi:MAG: NAD(P)-dependent oxidoreductase [Myxococcota bacterium]
MSDWTVGFVGLGTMGAPMASNLARAGFRLRLASRTFAKAEALAAEIQAAGGSAIAVQTPKEAAHGAKVLVSCVPDSPDVEAVHLGDSGTIHALASGAVLIDCSTIAPEVAKKVAARVASAGGHFLDAPVSGGQKGAIEAKLSFFVGGEASALSAARPVFEAMGKRITHLGPSGAGQLGKAANQVIVALNLIAMAEGLFFAKRAGLPLEDLHAALTGGAANSWALEVLGKKVLDGDMKPAFAVRHQQKDLAIVLETARKLGAPLPGVALVHQLLSALEASGRGGDGTQALFGLYERLL